MEFSEKGRTDYRAPDVLRSVFAIELVVHIIIERGDLTVADTAADLHGFHLLVEQFLDRCRILDTFDHQLGAGFVGGNDSDGTHAK